MVGVNCLNSRSLCQGNVSFCTNPSIYPREAAKLALENLKGQHAILRMMDSRLIFPGQSVSIADGFERPEGRLTQFHNEFKWESHLETRICPSDVHFITPKRAMNNRKVCKFSNIFHPLNVILSRTTVPCRNTSSYLMVEILTRQDSSRQ